jgi:hypothetical protein
MDYFLNNWGSFVGVIGVIISTGGLVIAFIAMVRAGKAREAAAAAEEAARDTQQSISTTLANVDLQRAIALVQRLKVLHREENWEASLEHYQPLRAMLSDINGRHPLPKQEQHTILREAIPLIRSIEDLVSRSLRSGKDPTLEGDVDVILNSIQESLEQIASSTHFA